MSASQQGDDRRRALHAQIANLLHPLVSPYDLSQHNLNMQLDNNPFFRRIVAHFTHLLSSLPEKVEVAPQPALPPFTKPTNQEE